MIEGKPQPPLNLKMKQNNFVVDEYVRNTKEFFQEIKGAISHSQQKQKKDMDKHRRPLEFKEDS